MIKVSRILIFLSLLASFSCSYKRFTYLQPSPGSAADTVYQLNFTTYKIQPADIIYIRITSLDEKVNAIFTPQTSASTQTMAGSSGGSFYLTQYSVDAAGDIIVPVIGKVHVGNLTIDEARKLMQEQVKIYVNDAIVDVKLVSFKISFLGEVNNKAQLNVFCDRANIFEVLSQAGDLNYYGNWKEVTIIRTIEGKVHFVKLDLTQRDIIASKDYYLQPNDIIYVKPMKSTIFRQRYSDYSIYFSLITTAITTVLLVVTLVK
jgi:polysaccharide export outer membrane protein